MGRNPIDPPQALCNIADAASAEARPEEQRQDWHGTPMPGEDATRGSIDGDLQRFLRERIESFDDLEVLLLLRRQPDRIWSPQAVAERLQIGSSAATAALENLCRQSLLNVKVGSESMLFGYAPAKDELARQVDSLMRVLDQSRLQILRLVGANAVERSRTVPLRLFADAFILGRKKKKDG
jgi:hypothetical protein